MRGIKVGSIGNVRALFHPGYGMGGFRFEQVAHFAHLGQRVPMPYAFTLFGNWGGLSQARSHQGTFSYARAGSSDQNLPEICRNQFPAL